MDAAASTPLKIGYLFSQNIRPEKKEKPEWHKRYYVLYPYSETNKARLDWFPDESAFKNAPLVRKTIFIEEVTKVKTTNVDGRPHGFQIDTLRRKDPFIFSGNTKKETKSWVDQLNRLLEARKDEKPSKEPQGGESNLGDDVYSNELWTFDEKPTEYPVTVGDTSSAVTCHISKQNHILQVFSHCIRLVDQKTQDTHFIWPYKYIRRYGRSKSSFTFEAGRRCASGEGVFILMSPQSENIFQDVQKGNAPGQDTLREPDLPSRSYGNHYGEMIDSQRQEQAQPARKPTPPKKYNDAKDTSNKAPPLPTGSRPSARNQQPLPPAGVTVSPTYTQPVTCNEDEDTYSSIEEEGARAMIAHIPSMPDGYSTPVSEDTSMSSMAAKIRMAQADMDSGEYDVVRLNATRLPSNQAGTNPSEVLYGHLYESGAPLRKPHPTKKSNDAYDDVQST